jgi:hypothetical protein
MSPRLVTSQAEPSSHRKKFTTVAEADDEAARLCNERDEAERELAERDAAREGIVLDGSAEQLRLHDEARARLRLSIEQVEARLTRVAAERAVAEQEAEQARRKALHKSALKAAREVAGLEKDYQAAAAAVVSILRDIQSRRFMVSEANASLPHDAEPIGEPETFNGRPAMPAEMVMDTVRIAIDRSGREVRSYDPNDPSIRFIERPTGISRPMSPATPGEPHSPLGNRVRLPGLGRDAAPIW